MKRQGSFIYYDLIILKKLEVLKFIKIEGSFDSAVRFILAKYYDWNLYSIDQVIIKEFKTTYHIYIVAI